MFHYIGYSIRGRKTANLVTVGIGIMLVLLLHVYFGSIHSYERQLAELAGQVPVTCHVTNANGTRGNGLFIPEDLVDGLMGSDRITDASFQVCLMAGEGEFEPIDYPKYLNLHVAGVNRVEAVDGLTEEMIHMEAEELNSFFASEDRECIVSEKVMRRQNWEVGDTVTLTFYYYNADSALMKLDVFPLGTAQVKIAGSMEDLLGKTSVNAMDMILPYEALRGIYHQYGIPFFTDTVTFCVKEPLALNAFKEEMRSIGFTEADPLAADSYRGRSLSVRDGSFIPRATDLLHSIEFMEAFFPVVCILVLLIGYVVSFLTANSRMEEYALLRLLGVRNGQAALLFLTEQMALVFLGNLLGDVTVLLLSADMKVVLLVNGVLLAAYLLGAAAAYGRMSRGNVMRLLSAQ